MQCCRVERIEQPFQMSKNTTANRVHTLLEIYSICTTSLCIWLVDLKGTYLRYKFAINSWFHAKKIWVLCRCLDLGPSIHQDYASGRWRSFAKCPFAGLLPQNLQVRCSPTLPNLLSRRACKAAYYTSIQEVAWTGKCSATLSSTQHVKTQLPAKILNFHHAKQKDL